MLQFEESFFKEEIREGFCVKSMMKRVWAAQMEVLKRFDENLRYLVLSSLNICNYPLGKSLFFSQ